MRIKTFLAKNMAEALQQIKADLGADALILDTKEIPCRSGTGRSSSVEVVAAVDDGGVSLPGADRVELGRSAMAPAPPLELAGEIADLDPGVYSPASLRRLAGARRRVPTSRTRKSGTLSPAGGSEGNAIPAADPVVEQIHTELLASGVDDGLACKLLQSAQELFPGKRWRTRSALVKALRQVVDGIVENRTGSGQADGRKVVMFFGPTGVGKTTALAKLAARLALVERKKVVLMSVDGVRIGAIEQLRTYASLMGVPFRFVGDLEDLGAAIREQSQRDVVLVDTGGINPKDVQSIRRLASFFQETTPIERHLVLSATSSAADTHSIVERFESCAPDYLLFTKLDEAAAPGGILNELVRSRKAPSFYTDGQRVPQDFHEIAKDGILDLVLDANRQGDLPCEIH